jgi:hypothetical protein
MTVQSLRRSQLNNSVKYRGVAAGNSRLIVDYLVVAGGGGGGGHSGAAGGGAGGLRCTVDSTGGSGSLEQPLQLKTNESYIVSVGAGGFGRQQVSLGQAQNGTNGSDSNFHTVVSLGGGAGGSTYIQAKNGGSGGGSAGPAQWGLAIPGTGQSNQGFDGAGPSGGGGGGAGGVGSNSGNRDGGAGRSSSITGTSIARGGGGGGGSGSSANATAGGGVVNTSSQAQGGNGTAGTGGGGAGGNNNQAPGGYGGSGIVILRYPSAFTLNLGPGLVGTSTTVGANKVTSITAGLGTVSWSE